MMASKYRQTGLVVAALILMGSLSACASGARPEAMTVLPSSVQAAQSGDFGHRGLKIINVNGGAATNPLWVSEVSNEDFRTALEDSLRATNYLGSSTDAPLNLTAALQDLKQPFAGLDLSVTSRVRYTVTNATGGIVFDDTVSAVGTARMGEAFVGTERLRLANEHSIRENIRSFIERFRREMAGKS